MQKDKSNKYDKGTKKDEQDRQNEEIKQDEGFGKEEEVDQLEESSKSLDLQEKVKDLECKIQEKEQSFLRLQADFDNYKKRVAKEKTDLYKFAAEKLVCELLAVLDNFERALLSIKEEEKNDEYVKGVEMVFHQLVEVLKKEGVEEIIALGEAFDPNLHHAVGQEKKEGYEDNTIIDVLQKGYKLKDKVIRPSMVRVCIH